MKRFSFPLDRVADFRRIQARIEEAKLEALYAQLRGFDEKEAILLQARAESESKVLSAPAVTGPELAALDRFRRFTGAERLRLQRQRAECRQKISAQMQVVTVKRRDVRLLEKLKERRLESWKADFARETDAQADEAYLAKWCGAGWQPAGRL